MNGQTSAASTPAPRPFSRSCLESPALSDLSPRAAELGGLIELELFADKSGPHRDLMRSEQPVVVDSPYVDYGVVDYQVQ